MRSTTLLVALVALGLGIDGSAADWIPVGPQGGDVRSLAVDPLHPGRVYLGAAGGVLYRSDGGGDRWRRLSPGFPRRDQNLDDLVVSPLGDLLVGFWDVHGRGGGVAVSTDGGATFTISLDGESVRALALAPSDAKHVVAGTLNGVFASTDGGFHWRRISPLGHADLRNVESVAVDPGDQRVIYAGTWHLPWKTTDGGLTWTEMSVGMLDDSDVFTLSLDRLNPQRVHATACSGIYGSRDGASTWSKVQGIPFASRRTRAFAQDTARSETFYAGTTEGLWVSVDDTRSWRLSTPGDLVINAIVMLSDGSVLAGADGAGVLRSLDRGVSWSSSNDGFAERLVSGIVDDSPGGRILASVWGDRAHGGVFSAASPVGSWTRLGEGLEGREVRSLGVTGSRVLAGTDRGLLTLGTAASVWRLVPLGADPQGIYPRVNAIRSLGGGVVVLATGVGLFRSEDGAESFRPVMTGHGEVTALALSPDGALSLAATPNLLQASRDGGRTWAPLATRPGAARINALLVDPESGRVLAATSRGLYRSIDGGATFALGGEGLPDSDFTGLVAVDGKTVFVSDFASGGIYRSADGGDRWSRLGDTGLVTDRVWMLATLPRGDGDLLAASPVGGLHLRVVF